MKKLLVVSRGQRSYGSCSSLVEPLWQVNGQETEAVVLQLVAGCRRQAQLQVLLPISAVARPRDQGGAAGRAEDTADHVSQTHANAANSRLITEPLDDEGHRLKAKG